MYVTTESHRSFTVAGNDDYLEPISLLNIFI